MDYENLANVLGSECEMRYAKAALRTLEDMLRARHGMEEYTTCEKYNS
jgi:hypothetical protein